MPSGREEILWQDISLTAGKSVNCHIHFEKQLTVLCKLQTFTYSRVELVPS